MNPNIFKTFFLSNKIATLRANLRAKSFRHFGIVLLGRTSLAMAKTAKIISKEGRLIYNRAWYGKNRTDAYLCLCENSTLELTGRICFYRGADVSIHEGATLKLDNMLVNNSARIHCSEYISIGRGTLVGEGALIRDSDEHVIIKNGEIPNKISAPIQIGQHVLICPDATILKGVTIGDGAVIAAGSIVTKNVPPGALVGGIPAKILSENIEWGPPGFQGKTV